MDNDTVWGKPSVHFTEWQGVCISGGLFVCKPMKMAFQTKQSVRIIVDGNISWVSARRGSTV